MVKEIAIIATADEKWGEVGLAVVEPESCANVTLEALLAYADGLLERYKQPKAIVVIDEMPRNATLTDLLIRREAGEAIDAGVMAAEMDRGSGAVRSPVDDWVRISVRPRVQAFVFKPGSSFGCFP